MYVQLQLSDALALQNTKKPNDIEFMSSVGFLCGYLNRNKSKFQNKNVNVLENFLHWSRFLQILEQMIRKRLLNC